MVFDAGHVGIETSVNTNLIFFIEPNLKMSWTSGGLVNFQALKYVYIQTCVNSPPVISSHLSTRAKNRPLYIQTCVNSPPVSSSHLSTRAKNRPVYIQTSCQIFCHLLSCIGAYRLRARDVCLYK